MIKLLVLTVAGLVLALLLALHKNSVLSNEIKFLNTSYTAVEEAYRDVRIRYLTEWTRANNLQEEVTRLRREKASEKTDNNADGNTTVVQPSVKQIKGGESR